MTVKSSPSALQPERPKDTSEAERIRLEEYKKKPIYKLSIGLIATYNGINTRYFAEKNRKEAERRREELKQSKEEIKQMSFLLETELRKRNKEKKERRTSRYIFIRPKDRLVLPLGGRNIGNGAFSNVYVVRSRSRSPIVAKQSNMLGHNQHIPREVKIIKFLNDAKVSHCIQLREKDEIEDENLYKTLHKFYMDRPLGESLRERYCQLAATKSDINYLVIQFCEFFRCLQDLDMTHADFKPDNILLDNNLFVRVIDFNGSYLGFSNRSITTVSYRPPERFLGMRCNFKADMWAMGCVLAGLWLKKNLFYIPGYRNTNGQNLFALHLMQIILGCRLPQEMVASVPKRIKERYFYLDSKTREYCLNPSPYSIPGDTLEEIIDKAPLPLGCSISDRDLFKNLLRSLLNIDPSKRIASKQVLDHPFVEKDKLVGFTIDLKNLSEIQTDKHVIISIFVINEERKLVLFKCHSYSQYLGKCLHMKKTEDDKYFIQIFDEAESPLCDPKLLDLSEIRTIKIEMNDSEVVSIGH